MIPRSSGPRSPSHQQSPLEGLPSPRDDSGRERWRTNNQLGLWPRHSIEFATGLRQCIQASEIARLIQLPPEEVVPIVRMAYFNTLVDGKEESEPIRHVAELALQGTLFELAGGAPPGRTGRPSLAGLLGPESSHASNLPDERYGQHRELVLERFRQLIWPVDSPEQADTTEHNLAFAFRDATNENYVAVSREVQHLLDGTQGDAMRRIADVTVRADTLRRYRDAVLLGNLNLIRDLTKSLDNPGYSMLLRDGESAVTKIGRFLALFDDMQDAVGLQRGWPSPQRSKELMDKCIGDMVYSDRGNNQHLRNFSLLLGHAGRYYAHQWLMFTISIQKLQSVAPSEKISEQF